MNLKDKGIQVRFIADNEYVSPKELADALKMVADTIRIVKDSATSATKEESNRLENRLNNLSEQIKRMVENSEKRGLKDIESLAKKITKIQSDIQKDFQDKFDELVLPDVTPFLSREEYNADRKAILNEAKTFFKDVELDTPEILRDKLETLKDDERLDKTAIKGLDIYDEALANLSRTVSLIPSGGGGSGGIEVFSSGRKVGGGSALNFTGSGVSAVTNTDGRMTTVTITGGGGSTSLRTNGNINATQTILDLKQGTNITLTDDGLGGITINASGGGGSPGGSSTQLQYNNAGSFGGITKITSDGTDTTYTSINQYFVDSVDATKRFRFITSSIGAGLTRDITVPNVSGTLITTGNLTSINSVGTIGTGIWDANTITGERGGTGVSNTGKTITLGGNLTTSGAFAITLTATGTTTVTLPVTGTLATLAGSETFTNKTLTSPTLTTPVLGTPSSGTLTNCTGLPIAGLVASTSTALGVGSIELGHASDTTLSRSAAGVLAVEGVVIPSISSTNTLTNKRVTKRVTTITSSATPTVNTDNCDAVDITALATAITSMTTNLSGTPANKDTLVFQIKDDGTARAITWGASFVAGGVALPTTTVISKILTVGFIYNTANALNKWMCIASAQEA